MPVNAEEMFSEFERSDTGPIGLRVFQIRDFPLTNYVIDLPAALDDAELPVLGDAYGSEACRLWRKRVATVIVNDQRHWQVTCEYRVPTIEDQESFEPIGTVFNLQGDAEAIRKKRTRDRLGADILDDDPTTPRVRTIDSEETSLIVRFDRVETGSLISPTYINKVNSDVWNGFAARTWYCKAVQARDIDQRADGAHIKTYTMSYDSGTWDPDRRAYINGALRAIVTPELLAEQAFSPLGAVF